MFSIIIIILQISTLIYAIDSNYHQEFLDYQLKYNRNYLTLSEYESRFLIFKKNIELINQHNVKNSENSFGITEFADLSPEEFHSKFLKLQKPTVPKNRTYLPYRKNELNMITLPTKNDKNPLNYSHFDWRNRNLSTKIEMQGSCWSCWAFTAVTNIEYQYFLKYGKNIRLSEQQLVDCDPKNYGCKGGLMTKTYEYIIANGLMLESDYPYMDKKQNCSYDKNKSVVFIDGYVEFDQDHRNIAQGLLDYGPLAAGINGRLLQFYKGGIIDSESCTDDLTHAVIIIGVGTDSNGNEFWILKNQWGDSWGEKGYFRVKKSQGKGICGINTYVSTAILKDDLLKESINE